MVDGLVKSRPPAKTGVQVSHKFLKTLDSAVGCAVRLEKRHYMPGFRGCVVIAKTTQLTFSSFRA